MRAGASKGGTHFRAQSYICGYCIYSPRRAAAGLLPPPAPSNHPPPAHPSPPAATRPLTLRPPRARPHARIPNSAKPNPNMVERDPHVAESETDRPTDHTTEANDRSERPDAQPSDPSTDRPNPMPKHAENRSSAIPIYAQYSTAQLLCNSSTDPVQLQYGSSNHNLIQGKFGRSASTSNMWRPRGTGASCRGDLRSTLAVKTGSRDCYAALSRAMSCHGISSISGTLALTLSSQQRRPRYLCPRPKRFGLPLLPALSWLSMWRRQASLQRTALQHHRSASSAPAMPSKCEAPRADLVDICIIASGPNNAA